MEPIKSFTSTIVALPLENVDTDQIIPARYLKVTDKAGLGDGLFHAWRYNADGSPKPDFVLNRPDVQGAQILIAGNNFGCGSSREHAPWALQGYGFKAVISTYFADIFNDNALKNGLLPIVVDQETYYQLVSLFEEDPTTSVTVDLANQKLILPGGQQVELPDRSVREALPDQRPRPAWLPPGRRAGDHGLRGGALGRRADGLTR